MDGANFQVLEITLDAIARRLQNFKVISATMAVADPRRLRRVRICRLKWVDIFGVFILAMWVVVPCSRALTPEG